VRDQASVQLRFNTDKVNDILKTMVVLDLSGQGTVESVGYGSKEPLAKRLASFGVDISDNPSFAELVSRLRGSQASVASAQGEFTGTILGVERREEASGNSQKPIAVPYLTMLTGASVVAVNMNTLQRFELQDKALAAELNKALTALAEHRADRTKTVDVNFRGTGQRDVIIQYVHEMPVWKVSYRLVLPDTPKPRANETAQGKATPTATMQGWAIVENTTDEDWQDVTLSLVSGRPVSFRMDLYEPLFTFRPEVPVPTIPGVLPRVYAQTERALAQLADMAPGAPASAAPIVGEAGLSRKAGRPRGTGGPMGGGGGFDAAGNIAERAEAVSADQLASYGALARASGVEVGEVFQYELATPVTIERQRSAMLPILTAPVQARRVSIFNAADSAENPMRGVEVTNTSNLQLLPGPIAVFDSAAYAGDAQIGHIGAGDKRLLAYAVDLDVAARVENSGSADLTKLRIVRGLIEQTMMTRATTEYHFTNKDLARTRTIVVEHAREQGADLVDSPTPTETNANLYRFELELPAASGDPASAKPAKGSVKVTQQRVYGQQVALFNYDLPTLISFQKSGKLSQAVLDALRKAGELQAAVGNAQQNADRLAQEIAAIDQDQNRIRQNMNGLDRQSELYGRYMKKLGEQETTLEGLRAELKAARDEIVARQRTLEQFVAELNVE
jgi:hypothetical protein